MSREVWLYTMAPRSPACSSRLNSGLRPVSVTKSSHHANAVVRRPASSVSLARLRTSRRRRAA
eukprot:scaffold124369_cov70-Phaeocystis_antarctica.AAC.1